MKKALTMMALVLLTVVISACGQKAAAPNNAGDSSQTQKGAVNPIEQKKADAQINTAEELRTAITNGQAMECSYKFKDAKLGMNEVTSSIQGKKYKSSFVMNGETYSSMMDGEAIYNWSEKSKKGTKMAITCLEDAKKALPANDQDKNNFDSAEKMVDQMMDINCKPAANIDLSLPKDVDFVDSCDQMKKAMQQVDKLKQGTSANTPKE